MRRRTGRHGSRTRFVHPHASLRLPAHPALSHRQGRRLAAVRVTACADRTEHSLHFCNCPRVTSYLRPEPYGKDSPGRGVRLSGAAPDFLSGSRLRVPAGAGLRCSRVGAGSQAAGSGVRRSLPETCAVDGAAMCVQAQPPGPGAAPVVVARVSSSRTPNSHQTPFRRSIRPRNCRRGSVVVSNTGATLKSRVPAANTPGTSP